MQRPYPRASKRLSTVEEVRSFVLARCAPLPTRRVATARAVGLVLAEAITSGEPVPPFASSAMDGFALRSVDTIRAPARLTIVAELMAGQVPRRAVCRSEAVRIMTGAPIPDGADAVCPIEDVRLEGSTVVVEQPVPAGKNVRRAGEEISPGAPVFAPGTILSPTRVGVLASLGVTSVAVVPRPRVGVLSTGDELVAPPQAPDPGHIRDANRALLVATLRQSHFDTVDLGIVSDDEKAVVDAFEEGLVGCDALVSSGGVSAGDRDTVREVIATLAHPGSARSFEVAVRPAKPFTFGILGDEVPTFGLPGNPVSALVAYELFCRPALLRLSGVEEVERPRHAAIADERIARKRDGKVHFVWVVASADERGALHARSTGAQHSHMLYSMSRANALAVLPDGEGVDAGEPLQLLLTDPSRLHVAHLPLR